MIAHSGHAFETREMALKDLESRRAEFPDAAVSVREKL